MEFYDSPRLGTRAKISKFNYNAQKTVSTSYDDSFGVKGARLWNILPKHVNTQSSLESFKVSLGEFLLKFPDRPPVMGYAPPNSNSLLDWNAVGGVGVCWSMCLTQNPDAIPAKPFLKYPKVSISIRIIIVLFSISNFIVTVSKPYFNVPTYQTLIRNHY